MRYENQFEYAFYVDPETEDYFVPKLMLQPLVENALYHGIKLCDRKCMLMIQVLSYGDRIEMEVLDNGAGMDAETLACVREAMEHRGENRTNELRCRECQRPHPDPGRSGVRPELYQ